MATKPRSPEATRSPRTLRGAKPRKAASGRAAPRPGTRSPAAGGIEAKALPLSDVRSRLSPLLRELRPTGKPVGVMVHGKVKGYLLSAEQLERMLGQARQEARGERRKRSLRGSMKLLRPLEGTGEQLQREVDEAVERSAAELLRG